MSYMGREVVYHSASLLISTPTVMDECQEGKETNKQEQNLSYFLCSLGSCCSKFVVILNFLNISNLQVVPVADVDGHKKINAF